MKKAYVMLLISLGCWTYCVAQQASVTEKLSKYQAERPLEKLYLSLDKPYYAAGDTLWYKAFLLNEAFGPSTISDKIHVELFNDSLKMITQRVTVLNNGLGYGDIAIDGKLPDGTYTLRAYTSWQQNFGTDLFFQTSFTIGSATDNTWLVDLFQQTEMVNGKKHVALQVKLKNIKNQIAGFRALEVTLFNGTKKLMSNTLNTKSDGTFETKIPVPDNPGPDYRLLIVDKKDKKTRALVPVKLSDAVITDLQFMPEGGYLVRGIAGRVGFKAIGQDGLGKAVSGRIVNSKNEVQATFTDTHNGMGSFLFLPAKGENYTAIYKSDGIEQSVEIKNIKEEGTTLKVDALSDKDSIAVAIRASEAKRVDGDYQLVVQGGGKVITAFKFKLSKGFFNIKLPASQFPGGTVNFTLFSPDESPLNERLVYVEDPKNIRLAIKAQKTAFGLRDSVALEIQATDENNQPLQGAFSVAVTSDAQVKQPAYASNIKSYYLLGSNVKGNIENGAWYFRDNAPETLTALDNLLLTQAWVGYKWTDVLKNEDLPAFKPEKDNLIKGRVYGLFKTPAANMGLTLMSLGKDIIVSQATTDKKGAFVFTDLPLIDSPRYFIKVKTAKNKRSDATIEVDEFIPAPPILYNPFLSPWYFNPDTVALTNYKNALIREDNYDKYQKQLSGIAIKEVEIRDLNPPVVQQVGWDANFKQEITEADLKNAPRKTLLDLLKERLPGLRVGTVWADKCSGKPDRHNFENFVVGTNLVASIRIDGISSLLVSIGMKDNYNETGISFTAQSSDAFATDNFLLNYLSAQDVKNIKIYKGCAYYFIEIISRSGHGPFIGITKGAYVHNPLPLNAGREFYSPKYTADSKADGTDLRSTIFWDANVVTGADGKAKLNFYTGDIAGPYTVKIEGTDLRGRFGSSEKKLNVSAGGPAFK